KIIIGGYVEYDTRESHDVFAVARLTADGRIDNSFSGGIVLTDFSSLSYGTSVRIQSDNKILLGGYFYNGSSYDFEIARYNTDGSLDNTFGKNGIRITQASEADDKINSIAIESNKLYAVGDGQYPGDFGIVARYFL